MRRIEHINNYDGRSVVGIHIKTTGHNDIDFNSVIAVKNIYHRRILEKLLIDNMNPTLNTKADCYFYLPLNYDNVLSCFNFKGLGNTNT